MSDRRDLPAEPAADPIAGETALGLLEGADRAAALRRMLSDRTFAGEVDDWRRRLGPLFDAWPGEPVPDDLFARIEASLDGTASRSKPAWIGTAASAILGAAAAAVLILLLVARPAPPPVDRAPTAGLLAASVAPTVPGAAAIVALYDPAHAAIRIGATPVGDASHSAELWVIAGDAPPRPLGLLRGARSTLVVSAPVRRAVAAGATLAISREPAGGSPTGQPTGPVIATGVLRPV